MTRLNHPQHPARSLMPHLGSNLYEWATSYLQLTPNVTPHLKLHLTPHLTSTLMFALISNLNLSPACFDGHPHSDTAA